MTGESPDATPRLHDIAEAQNADTVITKVLQWIAAGERPSFESIKQQKYTMQTFWHNYDGPVVKDGSLSTRCDNGQHIQQVVPPTVVPPILEELYSGMLAGHFGG